MAKKERLQAYFKVVYSFSFNLTWLTSGESVALVASLEKFI